MTFNALILERDGTAAVRPLAADLPADTLDAMIQPATLADVPNPGVAILEGKVRGRVVVDVNA